MTVDVSDNTPMGEMQEQLRLEMQDDDDDLIHHDQSLMFQCLMVEGPIGRGATRGRVGPQRLSNTLRRTTSIGLARSSLIHIP